MIKLYNYVHEKKTIKKTPAFCKSFPFQATVITVTSCWSRMRYSTAKTAPNSQPSAVSWPLLAYNKRAPRRPTAAASNLIPNTAKPHFEDVQQTLLTCPQLGPGFTYRWPEARKPGHKLCRLVRSNSDLRLARRAAASTGALSLTALVATRRKVRARTLRLAARSPRTWICHSAG